MTPFSLRIFVADGDPDGLRIVERFNASARAVVFPRALLPQVKARPESAAAAGWCLMLKAHLRGFLDHLRILDHRSLFQP
ncbi:MAG: hypothetical protein Q7J58_06900 [Hydrogenophaga sp.]|uniref:hypothetical protein n=1 Tax=Hydrogenophaga sp. TaxID=1904254 RepID=UPI002721ABCB|nr:hypothetical protein [Hydrogenophaga sp.]MDO9569093.1 hypothetical protein [Hydrogenophaga sp.]MDP3373210.1 hypothetical protein [Hydrogenophaga sp.]